MHVKMKGPVIPYLINTTYVTLCSYRAFQIFNIYMQLSNCSEHFPFQRQHPQSHFYSLWLFLVLTKYYIRKTLANWRGSVPSISSPYTINLNKNCLHTYLVYPLYFYWDPWQPRPSKYKLIIEIARQPISLPLDNKCFPATLNDTRITIKSS